MKSYDSTNEIVFIKEEVRDLKYKLNESERVNQELYNDLVSIEKELEFSNQQYARYQKDMLKEIKMLEGDV
jgi:predicted RNase H-like nuclease (RuvC/YqgF family)